MNVWWGPQVCKRAGVRSCPLLWLARPGSVFEMSGSECLRFRPRMYSTLGSSPESAAHPQSLDLEPEWTLLQRVAALPMRPGLMAKGH